ncbi:MAG: hypothetical protein RL684_522 [Pseudomonadota bacterium]
MYSFARNSAWIALALLAAQGPAACAAEVMVAGGTPIHLLLLQNVASSLTPVGSPIYFSVLDDVLAAGQVAIRHDTVVEGSMMAIDGERRGGFGATMSFGVRSVRAVDGQPLRVLATQKVLARSRQNEVAITAGLLGIGLLAKGLDAHLERGAVIEALALTDRYVRTDAAASPPPAGDSPAEVARITSHRLADGSVGTLRIDPERAAVNRHIAFELDEAPGPLADVQLYAVNEFVLPQPLAALEVSADGKVLQFGDWSIAQFCNVGKSNDLHFRWRRPDGPWQGARHSLDVAFGRH